MVCKRVRTGKVYQSLFQFGIETDTLDPEGQVIATSNILPTRDQINSTIQTLTGDIEIEIPKFSAVHINGKRAYDLARRGIEFESPRKTVRVEKFEQLGSPQKEPPQERSDEDQRRLEDCRVRELWVEIECQTGTYIRSLAKLLAQKLGTVAIAAEIRRTRVGNFDIRDAKSPDGVTIDDLIVLQ